MNVKSILTIAATLVLLGCAGSRTSDPPPLGHWTQPVAVKDPVEGGWTRVNAVALDDQGGGLVTLQANSLKNPGDYEGWIRPFRPDGSWEPPSRVTFPDEPGYFHQVHPDFNLIPSMVGGGKESWLIGMASRYFHHATDSGLTGSPLTAMPLRGGEPAGGTHTLAPVSQAQRSFRVAGNGRDTVLGAWVEEEPPGPTRLFTNRLTTGQGWAADPTELPLPGSLVSGEDLAASVTAGGVSFLSWITRSLRSSTVMHSAVHVAMAKPGQPWSEPLELAGPGTLMVGQVALAAGPGETAALAWASIVQDAKEIEIKVSLYRPDLGWSEAQTAARVQAAIKDGTTLVFTGPEQLLLAYVASDQPKSKAYTVRTAWYSAGRWSQPRVHSRPSTEANFGLGSDGSGHAVLVWREERPGLGASALASLADAPESWRPAVSLSTGDAAGGSAEHISVAMSPNGTACAIWNAVEAGRPTGWVSLFRPGWKAH